MVHKMSGIPNRVCNAFSSAVFTIGTAIFIRALWAVSSLQDQKWRYLGLSISGRLGGEKIRK